MLYTGIFRLNVEAGTMLDEFVLRNFAVAVQVGRKVAMPPDGGLGVTAFELLQQEIERGFLCFGPVVDWSAA